jgi:hypothetical protein
MKQIKIGLMLFVFNGLLFSQEADFPKLLESDFPGLKITREQYFDGNSLWGYINGGADIYLEYGFDKLFLQEIEIDQYKFKIEHYKMSNLESAFGIYSVSHYRCDEKTQLVKYSCISQYQIQCAASDYYISIINTNGSKEEQELSNEIFEKVVSKIPGGEFAIPEIFHNKDLIDYQEQIKYFKGILGVQNGLSEWYDYFENFSNYEIYFLPKKVDDKIVNVAQVKFGSGSDVKRFLSGLGIIMSPSDNYLKSDDKGIARIVKMISDVEMIFIEGNMSMNDLENIAKRFF